MTRSVPVGGWGEHQDRLRAAREESHAQSEALARHAGQVRGSRGDIGIPPWMSHIHELFPEKKTEALNTYAQAHRYGQIEGYTDTEPDRIEAEVRPQAMRLAKQQRAAAERLDMASTTLRSAGLRAAFGGRRTAVAGSLERQRLASVHYGEVQANAAALHESLNQRLHAVDTLRAGLASSPWQPPDKRDRID